MTQASEKSNHEKLITELWDVMNFYAVAYESSQGFKLSDAQVTLYYRILVMRNKLSIEMIREAFDRHVESEAKAGSFFPRPSDLMRVLKGSTEDNAHIAWGAVVKAAKEHGYYRSVKFEDTAIHSAIEAIGGWKRVCIDISDSMTSISFLQRDFIKSHMAFKNQPQLGFPEVLKGYYALGGFGTLEDRQPRLIGDSKLCHKALDAKKTRQKALPQKQI